MGGICCKITSRGTHKYIDQYRKKSTKYKKLLPRKYSKKEDDLKYAFVILHGGENFHFITILSLLDTVFTREFYIWLNKWDKEQQSFPDIVATTAALPINEVIPDKSTQEGK